MHNNKHFQIQIQIRLTETEMNAYKQINKKEMKPCAISHTCMYVLRG